MDELPFEQPGQFWRGNLHTHSNRSDGDLPPEQVVRWYQEAGYDFLAITDHFRPKYRFPLTDTRGLRTGDFTTLLGPNCTRPGPSSPPNGTSSRSGCRWTSRRQARPKPGPS